MSPLNPSSQLPVIVVFCTLRPLRRPKLQTANRSPLQTHTVISPRNGPSTHAHPPLPALPCADHNCCHKCARFTMQLNELSLARNKLQLDLKKWVKGNGTLVDGASKTDLTEGWTFSEAKQPEFIRMRDELIGAQAAVDEARGELHEHLDKDMHIRCVLKDSIDMSGDLNSKWINEWKAEQLRDLRKTNPEATEACLGPMPAPPLCSRDGLMVYHIDE